MGYENRFLREFRDFSEGMETLSRGELDFALGRGRLGVLQHLKSLQGNLRHLTWKTQQIAGGDFEQKVDFMGDFSVAFNSMTRQLREALRSAAVPRDAVSTVMRTALVRGGHDNITVVAAFAGGGE